ncbi:MAG: sulfotransferase [Planctomycetota bacterium]
MTSKPSIFVVGAPKCGTTSLCAQLAAHPQVFFPAVKEPFFFGSDLSGRFARPLEEYLRLYDAAADRRAADGSVFYLRSEKAAREIRAFNPDARVLVLIRRPLEMMHSLHGQMLHNLDEDIADFEQALAAEDERRAGRRIPDGCRHPYALAYTEMANYAPQIRRYFEVFGRDRVWVHRFEDLLQEPQEAWSSLTAFLGLEDVPVRVRLLNPRSLPRSVWLKRFVRDERAQRVANKLVPFWWRAPLARLVERANSRAIPRPTMSRALIDRLAGELEPEVRTLGNLLQLDLTDWIERPVTWQ